MTSQQSAYAAEGGNITLSSTRGIDVNQDDSVDVYFGPTLPKGANEKNWIKTDPKKGFFVVFRFFGPLEGYIDKTWVLNDFELIELTIVLRRT